VFDVEKLERERQEYQRCLEYKESLTGNDKKLFDMIERVYPNARYCLTQDELILLAKVYENNLINGSFDIFRYGFLKGQRAERARRKRGTR
jgi:hypothetical protein